MRGRGQENVKKAAQNYLFVQFLAILTLLPSVVTRPKRPKTAQNAHFSPEFATESKFKKKLNTLKQMNASFFLCFSLTYSHLGFAEVTCIRKSK